MRLVPYVWVRGYLLVDRLRPFGSVGEVLCEAAFFVPVLLALRALTDFTGFSAVFVEVEGVSAFVVAVLRGAAGFVVGSFLDSTAFAVAVLVARVEALCARVLVFFAALFAALFAGVLVRGLLAAGSVVLGGVVCAGSASVPPGATSACFFVWAVVLRVRVDVVFVAGLGLTAGVSLAASAFGLPAVAGLGAVSA